jgi:hypothetical protein
MSSFYDDAVRQVRAESPAKYQNKAEAVADYQRQFPGLGKGGWKQHLIHDLLASRDLPPNLDKAEYSRLKKNLSKRFDSGSKGGKASRLNNPEPRNDSEYQALAIVAPDGGYHVHYVGGLLFSECELREFDVDITGDDADTIAKYPDKVVQIAIMIYMQLEGEDEESIPGPCSDNGAGEPVVTVTANDIGFTSSPVKRHKKALRTSFFR